MKPTAFLSTLTFLLTVHPALSYPKLNGLLSEIKKRQDNTNDGDANPVLIGDLRTGATTPVGQSISNILLGNEAATSSVGGYQPPGLLGTAACKKDMCCPWWYASQVLTLYFTGITGRCNDNARAAVRLGFHDAGAWSQVNADAGNDFGGADGSIALDGGNEISRPENNGLQQITAQVQQWQKLFGVGMADLIQFAAIHATVTCPLGPRIRFFVGRQDSKKPALDGLLPDVHASADTLISLFRNKTISPHELVALVGAHSTSKQFFVDKSKAGLPQDSTPGVWDVAFYNQTVANPGPSKIFKFESDVKLAADDRTKDEWIQFMDPVKGQDHWVEDYARAYTRLSLLGVNVINNLTECTKVLPAFKSKFFLPTVEYLDQ